MTVVNPSPRTFCDHLAATVALREVIQLAADAPGITDEQLRDRLQTLAKWARPAAA